MPDQNEPTDAEIAAAQAVLTRKADAEARRVGEALVPIKAIVEHDAFAPLLEQAEALLELFSINTTYGTHLNAMVVGMGALQHDVAAAVPPGIVVKTPAAA